MRKRGGSLPKGPQRGTRTEAEKEDRHMLTLSRGERVKVGKIKVGGKQGKEGPCEKENTVLTKRESSSKSGGKRSYDSIGKRIEKDKH